MNAEIMAIVSGIVLLAVFALAGWRLRRKRSQSEETGSEK